MPIVAKIEILLDDNGQVSVTGPIDNRLLSYGMLGVAHDSIQDHNAKLRTRQVVEMTDQDREVISRLALKQ